MGDPVPLLCFVSKLSTHAQSGAQDDSAYVLPLCTWSFPQALLRERLKPVCAVSRLGPPSDADSSPALLSLHSSSMAS